MPEMFSQPPIRIDFGILHEDIDPNLVSNQLARQRSKELFHRVCQNDWEKLKLSHPNLVRFIATVSHETAPTDPILREQVAVGLLGMYALLDEAAIDAQIKRLCNEGSALD